MQKEIQHCMDSTRRRLWIGNTERQMCCRVAYPVMTGAPVHHEQVGNPHDERDGVLPTRSGALSAEWAGRAPKFSANQRRGGSGGDRLTNRAAMCRTEQRGGTSN